MPARTSRRTPASFWWDGSSPERSPGARAGSRYRSEEHTSELQSQSNLVCRLLLEKKKRKRPRVGDADPGSVVSGGEPARQLLGLRHAFRLRPVVDPPLGTRHAFARAELRRVHEWC